MDESDFNRRDQSWMRRALRLARRGWGFTSPNPMVGAIVVDSAGVAGEGYHAAHGADHAEVVALNGAGERARGATLYVTLEPCNHFGRTPPCTQAIIKAGIRRVVYAVGDPNPDSGDGSAALRAAGIQVQSGLESAAAVELNAAFLSGFASDRPWTTLKLALSLDSAISDGSKSSTWITGMRARREVHRMRAGADAVAVGIGTVLIDDPQLTVRHGVKSGRPPVRIVIARESLLPATSAVVRTAREVPTWFCTASDNAAALAGLEECGVEVVRYRELPGLVQALRAAGIASMLLEGGAAVAGAFLDAGLVDRLVLIRAPLVLGQGSLNAFGSAGSHPVQSAHRLRLVEQRELGQDILTTFAITEL